MRGEVFAKGVEVSRCTGATGFPTGSVCCLMGIVCSRIMVMVFD